MALTLLGCGETGRTSRPDAVLVVLDTLRADRLGFLGAERETAPFLARLAERSVVCEGALSSSSWTAPSTASLFTGVYPDRHGLTRGLFAQRLRGGERAETLRLRGIRPSLETLPERMRAAGFATFGVSSNPNVDEALGFTRGFDRFECRPRAGADVLLAELGSWEREIRDADPAFVYLHLNDVHAPYVPRAPWYRPGPEGTDPLQAYDSEISWLDARLEEVFARHGWENDAVVMVVSDHGEEFGDHGGEGHGYSLYGELSEVLLLFRAPWAGFVPARVPEPVSLIDALPTLLELAGVEPPRGMDGRSLASLGDAQRQADLRDSLAGRTLFAHRSDYGGERALWAATDGDWKLILEEAGAQVGATELFDLRADPAELAPLQLDAHERGAALARALGQLRARAAGLEDYEGVEIELDESRAADLRALGYVDER